YVANGFVVARQYQEARAEYARDIELNAVAPWYDAGHGSVYLQEGKLEESASAAQADTADWARLTIFACVRWSQKRIPESDAALAQFIKDAAETAADQIADVYACRGDEDKAFEWLERARRQRDAGLPTLRVDPYLQNLHDDPRWNAFTRTMGSTDDQLK